MSMDASIAYEGKNLTEISNEEELSKAVLDILGTKRAGVAVRLHWDADRDLYLEITYRDLKTTENLEGAIYTGESEIKEGTGKWRVNKIQVKLPRDRNVVQLLYSGDFYGGDNPDFLSHFIGKKRTYDTLLKELQQ